MNALHKLTVSIFLCFCLGCGQISIEKAPKVPEQEWVPHFGQPVKVTEDAGVQAAISRYGSDRVALLFTASWCGACQELKSSGLVDQAAKWRSDILIIYVDTDSCKSTVAKYQVKSIPKVGYEGKLYDSRTFLETMKN